AQQHEQEQQAGEDDRLLVEEHEERVRVDGVAVAGGVSVGADVVAVVPGQHGDARLGGEGHVGAALGAVGGDKGQQHVPADHAQVVQRLGGDGVEGEPLPELVVGRVDAGV